MLSSSSDVLIIGAGAAGLAAAGELARTGHSVLVLEARERVGGRCWSHHEAGFPLPIEFGAEFIHGHSAPIFALLQKAGAAAVDSIGTHWLARRGELRLAEDLFPEIRQVMRVQGARAGADVSFAAFLAGELDGTLSPAALSFARTLVEGYDGADPDRISAAEVVDEWTGEGAADSSRFRPQGGYGTLMAALAASTAGSKVRLQLESTVRTVRWQRGRVEVTGRRLGQLFRAAASRAIITLPLGVLQRPARASDAVRFIPALKQKQHALQHLAPGAVVKVALRFRKAFWEELDRGRYRDAAFFHSSAPCFPTFWTALPVHAPLMIAWTGGPRASQLAGADPSNVVREAITSLTAIFGKRAQVEGELEAAYTHDWLNDPYARGVYSHVLVGGGNAREELALPLRDTLFFAGEAADLKGEASTVGGALQSGVRAARALLRA